jgi:Signal peptidase subunit
VILNRGQSRTCRHRLTTMHNTIQRLNSIFSTLTTVLFVLAGCIALTSYLIPSSPTTNLRVSNFRVFVLVNVTNNSVNGRAPRNNGKATEFAFLEFDLDAGIPSSTYLLQTYPPCSTGTQNRSSLTLSQNTRLQNMYILVPCVLM